MREKLRWAVFSISLLGTFVVMALPAAWLVWIRAACRPLAIALTRVEKSLRFLDMDHVVFFAILAFIWCLILPASRRRIALLSLPVLAVATELIQFLVPTRAPKINDARDDIIGAIAGWILAMSLIWLFRLIAGRKDTPDRGVPTREWSARPWLLALLRGEKSVAMPADAEQEAAALQAANDEGVVVLIHNLLCDSQLMPPVRPSLLGLFSAAAQAATARGMWLHNECRRISAALSDAGVPAIWLKGVALSQWLYPRPSLREFADVDLLLPDHATALRAAAVLVPIGYALPNRHIAGNLVVHELLAFSDRMQLELDLHWGISNAALFANRLSWSEMSARSMGLPEIHASARGLSRVDAAIHACVHRANNFLSGRENRLRWLYDIHLTCACLQGEEWAQFVELARARELADPCFDALKASRDVLDTIVPDDVMRQLASAAQEESLQTHKLGSWTYFQVATWRQLPSLRARLSWLRQLLFPDIAHLRARYGMDGAGRMKILIRRLADGFVRWCRYH